jgi:hypothetical protein
MSKPRFKLVLEVDTVAHANTIKNSIVSELAGKDIFEQHLLRSGQDPETSKIGVVADWRFNTAIDRDAMRDWAEDQIQNNPQVKVWVTSAKLSWHRCTHDDGTTESCDTTGYAEWTK